jgi:uncharacterized protein (DUF1499 family)
MAFLIAAIIVAIIFMSASMAKSGQALGINDQGKLAQCPNKPNCVCSEYPSDAHHYLEALAVPTKLIDMTMPMIKGAVEELGGQIQIENNNYLAATFSSKFFGFIDDVEFRLDSENHLIHFRSAARTGHSDFSVNKNRMLKLKHQLQQKLKHSDNASH